MEKTATLKQLLDTSIAFSPEEKQKLYDFFVANPDRIDEGIDILEQEQSSLATLQETYNQNVLDMAESLVQETEEEEQSSTRKHMQELLQKERQEKEQELDQLDQLLTFK